MSFENKRRNLRISLERRRGNINRIPNSIQQNLSSNTQTQSIEHSKPKQSGKRIKTTIKSSNLGKNLHPDYIGKFTGESFIVAGCGESINHFDDFSDFFVIGVNDIERILTPDFLVVVNDYRTFMRGRWEWVRESMSPVIFSHLDNPGPISRKDHLVKIRLGERNNVNLDRKEKVDHTMNSPYMAAIIAYQLGAKKIAIVGVDFTQNRFFQKTGSHKLNKHAKSINEEYRKLGEELKKKGIKIANLSTISEIESWPKMSIEEFRLL
jgi:uncharacterized Rossmann fold enzyme